MKVQQKTKQNKKTNKQTNKQNAIFIQIFKNVIFEMYAWRVFIIVVVRMM